MTQVSLDATVLSTKPFREVYSAISTHQPSMRGPYDHDEAADVGVVVRVLVG